MASDSSTISGPVAFSPDGRRFHFTGPVGLPFEPGSFVGLAVSTEFVYVGQIDDITLGDFEGSLHGAGRVLGRVSESGRIEVSETAPFTDVAMHHADPQTVDLIYTNSSGVLPIGSILGSDDIPARLIARKFNRHTFWVGQSGSGKTYALGVVLEQLLLHTRLPMVIFDPNGDFVRMGEAAASGSAHNVDDVRELAERDIRILRPSAAETDADALCVRYTDLSMQSKAAVVRVDPVEDRAEFNELMHLEQNLGSLDPARILPVLHERGTPAALALAARTENLRVLDWEVWAGPRTSVTDVLDTRPDATVLDMGGFDYPGESLAVALAVLDDLWEKREQRRPILIVIDEAHNFCAPEGDTPLEKAVRERLIQIAAEGRKFGLWLLLSTQRPSRVHPSIISQCDNLALLKMSSPIDLDELATIFGFVPPAMFERSPRFRQGEALFAGGFVPAPTMVKMGARLTREGGSDVDVPLRTAGDPQS